MGATVEREQGALMNIVSLIVGAITAVITSVVETIFWALRRHHKSEKDRNHTIIGNALGLLGGSCRMGVSECSVGVPPAKSDSFGHKTIVLHRRDARATLILQAPPGCLRRGRHTDPDPYWIPVSIIVLLRRVLLRGLRILVQYRRQPARFGCRFFLINPASSERGNRGFPSHSFEPFQRFPRGKTVQTVPRHGTWHARSPRSEEAGLIRERPFGHKCALESDA
jgi:hypothetical protein